MKNKCPGSGLRVALSWPPERFVGDGPYPGGVICPVCSLGLDVVKGSVRIAEYVPPGPAYLSFTGRVRAHHKTEER